MSNRNWPKALTRIKKKLSWDCPGIVHRNRQQSAIQNFKSAESPPYNMDFGAFGRTGAANIKLADDFELIDVGRTGLPTNTFLIEGTMEVTEATVDVREDGLIGWVAKVGCQHLYEG